MLKRLTIDDIYAPEKKQNFDGAAFGDVIWIDDNEFILRQTDRQAERTKWLKIHKLTGKTEPLYDAEALANALRRIQTLTDQQADRLAHQQSYVVNPKRTLALLNHDGCFYLYVWASGSLTHLRASGTCEEFSPDGNWISFVRDNDLFVLDVETRREVRLTFDGSPQILNGRLDWVYQEEIYGRDNFKGYWWSPDSKRIVFLRIDESKLKPFPVTDHVSIQPELETTNYPLAGDPNPSVRIGVVEVTAGTTAWIDTSKYDTTEFLVVRVGWTADSTNVVYQVQDREQHWLDLNVGRNTILHEQRKTWVAITGEPKWLQDGSFLWLSEESGWAHIYHVSADGHRLHQITEGEWEVRSILDVDERAGFVYFSGTKDSPICQHTYRVGLAGGPVDKLTDEAGTHRSFFNPAKTHFVDFWSDLNTPSQVRLLTGDGVLVRMIDENRVAALTQFELGLVELLQVKTRDGFGMNAMLFKPRDFDSSRRYPVLVYAYGGPHHPQVVNTWGGEKHLWHRMLAGNGYLVWICDNRTASGQGAQSTWPLHRQTGDGEVRDLEDGVAWLKAQPYVDETRIGLWGWSYGGYLTLYALTHSITFKMGIAGAAVTDWRNYDSVYTERYMDMPQNNPDGYEQSSVVKSAANLHGSLLLIHGATDDNVHLQNTMQLAYELQKAGKQFQLMVYPRTRHAVTDPWQMKHLRTLMTDFVLENL